MRWDDPNLRFVDLDGDGHADVLITEHHVFTWHSSLAEQGFGPAHQVAPAPDEETGPRLVFADGTQSIHLADMCGDGLTALVRIRNGEVCYWPNLGYGRFGAKVTMDNAPRFDRPDQFDQRRVRLADIDGSGTNDVIYLDAAGARIYFNQCGNRWSDARRLRHFPLPDQFATVTTADLFGNGTACLVWSSALPGASPAPLQYVDLMGGQKPHLLIASANNLGAETRIHYRASTHFYLADKAAGQPWITRLLFPVYVVERVELFDQIGRNRFATRYAYHHGYFDGFEREFRGFGLVEQWDTETLAALQAAGDLPTGDNVDAASYAPPVHTKTWFHTGVYLGRERISNFHAGLRARGERGEYYREPGLGAAEAAALLLDDTVLPAGLTPDEEREACRALRGSMLRREVYARDDSDRAARPYQVTEQNFTIQVRQLRGDNRHGVFFVHAREVLDYHYERTLVPVLGGQMVDAAAAANPNTVWRADPRVAHHLTLEVDAFGNVLQEATIAYGRRYSDPELPTDADRAAQARAYVTYTANRVTNAVAGLHVYRAPLICARTVDELTGLALAAGRPRFELAEIAAAGAGAAFLAFEAPPTPGQLERRLLRHERTIFRRDDLTGGLPLGQLQSLALPHESYQLAFTPGLLAQEFQRQGQPLMVGPAAILGGPGGDRGGYESSQSLKASGAFPATDLDGHWWRPAGRVFFSPGAGDPAAQELAYARQHFFLPGRFRDPFHSNANPTETIVTYDGYDLLLVETRDAVGNRLTIGERDAAGNLVSSGNDYRVLQPALLMDPNRNRTRVAFDALGLVVGSAVMGKPPPAPPEGDSLDGFVADLPENDILNHLADPLANPQAILGRATLHVVYDPFAYHRTRDQPQPQPVAACALARETHDGDPVPPGGLRFRHSFSYSDGLGRQIQQKLQAEPGPVPVRDGTGRIIVDANGYPQLSAQPAPVRWVGTGWTVFNNKGQPVRQFEPFFTDTHRFDFDVRIGVSPVVFYDPIGRATATLHPDHTWNKIVFAPWRQAGWDVGDTILVADPRADPDAGSRFRRLPPAQFLPTWFSRRQGGALGPREQDAARKAAVHAATPSVVHTDALGRTFLSVAHNRFKYSNTPPADPPVEAFHASRVVFDITGNQREVIDARDRVVIRYGYDLLGVRVRQSSMEAGERWLLSDVSGKPIRTWDSRGHLFRTIYDRLRRPVRVFVTGADPGQPNQELLTGRLVYGEQHPEGAFRNLRGALFAHLDQAGALTNERRDFKGNLRRGSRRLAREYRQAIDWTAVDAALPGDPTAVLDLPALAAVLDPRLEAETFENETAFDALNRPVQLIAPHATGTPASILRPRYNEANLLEQLDAVLRGESDNNGQPVWTPFVTNIDYDARGRRTLIQYGNGAETRHRYDPDTLRLTRLYTRRGAAFTDDCDNVAPPPPRVAAPPEPADGTPCGLQNLHYSYDPAGNITHLHDDAQQVLFFRNQRVEPSADYTYDALRRLIEATGREHLGQAGAAPTPHSHNDAPRVGLWHPGPADTFQPGDGNAMGIYRERYVYDAVGNMQEMHHHRAGLPAANWTRTFEYIEPSQLDPVVFSNRLSRAFTGANAGAGNRFRYDRHGNMIRMPHLGGADPASNMVWDHQDELSRADLGGGGTAYYVYDAGGRRVRKVVERAPGLTEERIYLGGFEVYRRRNGGGAITLERETFDIMDGEQRVALVEMRTQGNDRSRARLLRFQLANHLGSTALELDDQAHILSHEEYSPFGSTVYQAVRHQTDPPKRYRYTAQERDEETGLAYHQRRYYAPWLARWSSCDPQFLIDGSNLYRFSRNNPIKLVDEAGTQPVEINNFNVGYETVIYGLEDNYHELLDTAAPAGEEIIPEIQQLIERSQSVTLNIASDVIGGNPLYITVDQLGDYFGDLESLYDNYYGTDEFYNELAYYLGQGEGRFTAWEVFHAKFSGTDVRVEIQELDISPSDVDIEAIRDDLQEYLNSYFVGQINEPMSLPHIPAELPDPSLPGFAPQSVPQSIPGYTPVPIQTQLPGYTPAPTETQLPGYEPLDEAAQNQVFFTPLPSPFPVPVAPEVVPSPGTVPVGSPFLVPAVVVGGAALIILLLLGIEPKADTQRGYYPGYYGYDQGA